MSCVHLVILVEMFDLNIVNFGKFQSFHPPLWNLCCTSPNCVARQKLTISVQAYLSRIGSRRQSESEIIPHAIVMEFRIEQKEEYPEKTEMVSQKPSLRSTLCLVAEVIMNF